MPERTTVQAPSEAAGRWAGLGPEALIQVFRTMYMSRRLDDREILLKRQNRVFFQISGAGHEAIQAAAGLALRAGHDWIYPYYRDRTLCLMLGVTAEQMLLAAVGAAGDVGSGGRQMPSHWSAPQFNIVSSSSPTGTQYLQAVGCAEAGRRLHPASDEITLVTSGEGATSEGEFWEALNAACLERLPVVFLVEDNGYAISTPTEVQYPGGNIAALLQGYAAHGLLILDEVDCCDPVASYEAMKAAHAHAGARKGPALVRATVICPYSHSLSDDEQLYKSKAQREAEAQRDPVITFADQLVTWGDLSEVQLQRLKAEVQAEIDSAWEDADKAPGPEPGYPFRCRRAVDGAVPKVCRHSRRRRRASPRPHCAATASRVMAESRIRSRARSSMSRVR